ncbi:hypothetical protein H2201_005525 [Coniosporium apollinis]|uniref:RING-type domain-containing protein n=1 Tax=Coniosporium apollinis TaxID=61459 RepID=A0ABQ9NRP0_9PEZI|nr:hypothetical protein H2201_005525 [Coniosporium apollinis]
MLPSVLSVQPAPREPTQQAVSIPEDHGVLEGSQVQEDAVPEEAAGTELEPPAVVCTTEHVARRSPEDNCVICQRSLAFEPLENLVWCKSQCGKNLHVACWQQWSEYLRRGPSRCVYCRGTWADPCEHDSAEPADSFWSVDDTGLERLFDRQTHIWSIWKAASVDGAGLEHLFDPQAHVWSVWTAGSVEDTGLRHLFDARTHAWSIWKAETVKDTGLRRLFNRQTHAWSLCTAESVDDTGLRRLFRPRTHAWSIGAADDAVDAGLSLLFNASGRQQRRSGRSKRRFDLWTAQDNGMQRLFNPLVSLVWDEYVRVFRLSERRRS